MTMTELKTTTMQVDFAQAANTAEGGGVVARFVEAIGGAMTAVREAYAQAGEAEAKILREKAEVVSDDADYDDPLVDLYYNPKNFWMSGNAFNGED